MNDRLFRNFLAIVDNEGVTRAAEALHVAQPSVSQALRQLEGALRVRLFDRVGRRLVLTEAGIELLPVIRRAVAALDEVASVADQSRNLTAGRITVVALPSLTVEPVPQLCSAFRLQRSDVSFVLDMALTSPSAHEAVARGEVFLAFATEIPGPTPGLRVHRLGHMELVLAAPPGTALPPGRMPTAALAGLPFVAGRPGTVTRELIDRLVAEGLDVPVVAEAASRDMAVSLVARGVGSALLAPQHARQAQAAGAVVRGLTPPAEVEVVLVQREGAVVPDAVTEFVEFTQENFDLRAVATIDSTT